ncbi:hypothetical protein GV791_10130 [Nocardia cyriacigeorgica]|uniref:Uncharacterized protein n=1 Tax=Nocardia cyriacigeorgica TaxID=135487 RepID=A0A6P1CKF7_9NOCA|nr:hypothetical protein [Nocardia cyriacigeorgica]MBF6080272.1 hypothetical protein [Nocardia cyriacigeorgica]MBF6423104.1 hypothetical protein [Nocardia cyriacigeorgica]NEW32918.1 hypothetical protein [Nocardia cyriacigeorgica]
MHMVRRFWIEFDSDRRADRWWVGPYAGVTGFDEQDGLTLVAELLGDDAELPPIRHITPDFSLNQKLPVNPLALGVPVWRGVWYPPVNLSTGPRIFGR